MIRPPSNVAKYNAFWSQDPAFVQIPDDASTEEKKEHAEKWERARKTGDYTELLIEGEQPTTFVMKPLKADHYAALVDIAASGEPSAMVLMAFRVALDSLANFPEPVAKENHRRFGSIATTACFDKAGVPGGVTNQIAQELGGLALKKAQQLDPL